MLIIQQNVVCFPEPLSVYLLKQQLPPVSFITIRSCTNEKGKKHLPWEHAVAYYVFSSHSPSAVQRTCSATQRNAPLWHAHLTHLSKIMPLQQISICFSNRAKPSATLEAIMSWLSASWRRHQSSPNGKLITACIILHAEWAGLFQYVWFSFVGLLSFHK